MTNSLDQGIAWVKAHPTRKNVPGATYRIGYGWSWSQLCVALVYWALGATHTYPTANAARLASKIVSTSRNVPDGAIVWFSMGKEGHVGFWMGGVFYSATRFASNLGSAVGTLTLEQYEELSGGTYLGYSWDFGGQQFSGVTIVSTGTVIPVTDPTSEGDVSVRVIHAVNDPTNAYQGVAAGSIAWVGDSSGSAFYTGAQLSIAMAEAKAYNPNGTLLDVTGDEMVVLIQQALARKTKVTSTVGAIDPQPILDAINKLNLLETTDHAALVSAIGNVPSAVRSKIIAP